ncbi:MAG TPA: TonB family protein [Candidatus Omnitrophota bacterium]|nr:TonB family protein [Candidatus Omnitrophota bacterium]HPN55754.1 TonB family protein [Candidatus Omnitrophota bacterium]
MHKITSTKQLIVRGVLVLCFIVSQISVTPALAQVQEVFDSAETQDVYLYKGDLISLKVYQLTRIAISTPGIVEIANADIDELLIVGQQIGETRLFIWDEYGKRQVFVRVLPEDLDAIMARIQRLLDAIGVSTVKMEKNVFERKIVLTGTVLSQKEAALNKVLDPFESIVFNYVDVYSELIQIDVQISELNTTIQKALGIDWNTGADGMILAYEETMPAFDGSVKDLFKIGDFRRTSAIQAIVTALIAEGEARILSKPSIVVKNGEQASFLVGGEIPVRSTTTSTGGASVQENVEYTSYGIDVKVTPEIVGEKIEIKLAVAIRDIDASNAVGENVAFTSRNADTTLFLDDGQTIVLAGLIKHNKAETVSGVPFLRRIPIVGFLFRNKNWPTDSEQEVVISMTPRIVTQKNMNFENREIRKKYSIAEDLYQEEAGLVAEASPRKTAEKKQPVDDEVSSDKLDSISDEIDAILAEDLEDVDDFPVSEELTDQEMDAMVSGEDAVVADLVEEADADASQSEPEIEEEAPLPEPSVEEGVSIDEATSQAITEYVQTVQKKISRAISFPMEAKEHGWEGTVVLSLVILNDGTLNDARVQTSSGHEAFDKDAINTARILAPFSSFPEALKLEELVVTIPIVYSQEAVLEGAGAE